ncbi:MAG: MerR family transcriptional regulator [Cytobacillus gottheilii]|uniref:MerR family transcriptional regulator n=1 Tax=Cytobacillus gottheilii TaxID=859144 RepID=UPI002147D62B|nr:MerR family transcriptional regulator [Cytobacillus gottheilii]
MPFGKSLLRIGQVAKLSGLTTRTIDYYTQNNLLPVERSSSNYRLYPEEALVTLEKIKKLKKEKMSLDQIKKLIQSDQQTNLIIKEVEDKILSLNEKIHLLEESLDQLPDKEREQVCLNLKEQMKRTLMKLSAIY